MNERGKTLTIFLVLISVLLLALTVIATFFFQKESEMRKLAQANLEQSQASEAKLQAELKESKKQVFLLEEKAKESEERISSLQGDLELAQGVRDKIKEENATLKEALEGETQAKEQIRTQMNKELTEAKKKVSDLETLLDSEKKQRVSLEDKIKTLEGSAKAPGQPAAAVVPQESQPQNVPLSPVSPAAPTANPVLPASPAAPQKILQEIRPSEGPQAKGEKVENEIQLGTIVVTPDNGREGKILSVDKENDFIIFDLGQKDGITQGTVMSIYRGKDYLGDVKVSKVQPDMAAADFIPPFSSQKVRKNDQIVAKK